MGKSPEPMIHSRLAGLARQHAAVSIFVLALAARIAAVVILGAHVPPPPWGDDGAYDRIAAKLLYEGQYDNAWYPPGYPLFLTLLYAVFGRSWLAVRLVQALLGAATCVLLLRLGGRLFGERVGAISGVALAVYPGHVYMCWRLMGEVLYSALLVYSVILAVQLLESPRPLRSGWLGAMLGAAQLVKSNLFAFPPLLVAWFAFAARAGRRIRLACVAAMIGGVALASVVTPVANSLSPGGRAVALPGNAGRTLWFANNPAADGYWIRGETTAAGRAFIERQGLTEALEQADEFERDKLYRELAITWIRENPGQFLALCYKKLRNAFGVFPRALSLEGSWAAQLVQAVSYGLVAPFALVGTLIAIPRFRPCAPLYAVLFSYLLMVVIFYGTPRFTLIIIPFLLIFASCSAALLVDRTRRAQSS